MCWLVQSIPKTYSSWGIGGRLGEVVDVGQCRIRDTSWLGRLRLTCTPPSAVVLSRGPGHGPRPPPHKIISATGNFCLGLFGRELRTIILNNSPTQLSHSNTHPHAPRRSTFCIFEFLPPSGPAHRRPGIALQPATTAAARTN